MKKIIAIDFDDTITYPSDYPIMGKIREDAVRVIKSLKNKYILLLWTARTGKYLEEALNLLVQYNIEFDYINKLPNQKGPKPEADIFIDDRNFNSKIDWNQIEEILLGGDDVYN